MTAPLRLLIVDDEALARARLVQLLQDLQAQGEAPPHTVVGQVADAKQAMQLIQTAAVDGPGIDAVLLDIGLPGQSGLQLARSLRQRSPAVAVIFVTAHAEHALEAFDVQAADYLTKPVRAARLAQALARAAQQSTAALAGAIAGATGPGAPGAPAWAAAPAVLLVPSRGRVLRVPHDEIIYLKAEHKLLMLRTASSTHWLEGSLTELGERLGPGFVRVHRNALVALTAMRSLQLRVEAGGEPIAADLPEGESWAVQVAPLGEWLPVSRRQVAAVRAALLARNRLS